MPTRLASSQLTPVRQTRVAKGMERSTWYTAPKVRAPAALICVPECKRLRSAGYRESTQKIPAMAIIKTRASVRERQVPAETREGFRFSAEAWTDMRLLLGATPGGKERGASFRECIRKGRIEE